MWLGNRGIAEPCSKSPTFEILLRERGVSITESDKATLSSHQSLGPTCSVEPRERGWPHGILLLFHGREAWGDVSVLISAPRSKNPGLRKGCTQQRKNLLWGLERREPGSPHRRLGRARALKMVREEWEGDDRVSQFWGASPGSPDLFTLRSGSGKGGHREKDLPAPSSVTP